MRTFYETEPYENMAEPGMFASLVIIGDDDGPHLMFRDGDEIIVDLALPVCDALVIHRALDRSIEVAMRAAEHLTEGFTEAVLERQHQPEPAHLEPAMTDYGPRDLPGDDLVGLPHRHVDHRELPVSRPARAIHPGQRRSA